jgi:ABC-2 type transport system permease protein
MNTLVAFIKKEWVEQVRSGRILILGIIFVLLGIMNPAIAKLTPWLFEMLSDSLEDSGMIVTTINVDAMSSWAQYFKNIPIGLIIFLLFQSSIFTKEYETGTLILALTKGLERYKVVVAKSIILVTQWTVYYWCCFGITYGYNEYFWDNGIAKNLLFSVVCWWLVGMWTITFVILFSTIANTNINVLAGTGGVFLGGYILSLIPKIKDYSPVFLMDGNSLITGALEPDDYIVAMVIAVIISIISFVISIPIFNKKKI